MQGTNVTLRTLTLFLWVCLIATAAVAGEEQRTHIKIAVAGDGKDHQVIEFNSQDSDIDLENLAIGESKSLTDTAGQEVTVTRTENGLEFDVEGMKIEFDHLPGGLHGEHDIDVEIDGREIHKEVRVIRTDSSDGVTIISGNEIDAEARAKIEEILKNAGENGDVMIIDGSELHDDMQAHENREVRIIKKEINVTN